MKDIVIITDERGKRHIARMSEGMVQIKGLGTVDSDTLMSALATGRLTIGGKTLGARPASVQDIVSLIERKTQTLTSKDIALMLHLSDVRPGSKVVEGGVGSGALTIALLASVGETGNVTTYELRDEFAEAAKRNIEMSSLGERWTLRIGNVCEKIEERGVDAVLLDIPTPWDCVAVAEASLRIGGHFCAFVPNINQLEKTVIALRGRRFADIRAIETLERELVVHEGGVRPSFDMLGHTGYLVFARRS